MLAASRWRSRRRAPTRRRRGRRPRRRRRLGQALAIQSQINFTRENEYEADRIGFQRLDAAGFDVYAMATMMDRLQKSSRFADGNAPSYLRSHPVTHERIAEAQARAFGKPYRQVTDSLEFHLVRALLRSYTGHPQGGGRLFQGRARRSQVQQRSGRALRSRRFAPARRGISHGQDRARGAREDRPPPPDDRRDGGSRADGIRGARSRHRALQVGAGALSEQDAAGLRLSAGAAQGRTPARSRGVPRARARALPQDGPLHRIAAQTYAELGQKQQEHRHQGEYYAWQGDFKGAVASSSSRRKRATAISTRRRSSRPVCGRCARSWRSSRRRSARTAEATGARCALACCRSPERSGGARCPCPTFSPPRRRPR